MPSPERTDREVDEIPEPATPTFQSTPEEDLQSTQPVHWFDRIQQRLGSPTRRSGYDTGVSSNVPSRPASVLNGIPGNQEVPKRSSNQQLPLGGAHQDLRRSQDSTTLESVHQLTSTVASSVNLIDHQFKLSILGRVGALEREVKEMQEAVQRARDTIKGVSDKISWRKGQPCDILERLDSMTSFTYAFCKGIEDAGIFQLRKFSHQ